MKRYLNFNPYSPHSIKHLYLGTIILRMCDSLLTSHEEYKIKKKILWKR